MSTKTRTYPKKEWDVKLTRTITTTVVVLARTMHEADIEAERGCWRATLVGEHMGQWRSEDFPDCHGCHIIDEEICKCPKKSGGLDGQPADPDNNIF